MKGSHLILLCLVVLSAILALCDGHSDGATNALRKTQDHYELSGDALIDEKDSLNQEHELETRGKKKKDLLGIVKDKSNFTSLLRAPRGITKRIFLEIGTVKFGFTTGGGT